MIVTFLAVIFIPPISSGRCVVVAFVSITKSSVLPKIMALDVPMVMVKPLFTVTVPVPLPFRLTVPIHVVLTFPFISISVQEPASTYACVTTVLVVIEQVAACESEG